MNRRNLLRSLATIPAVSTLAACQKQPQPSRESAGTLKVILNGPFGVVINRENDFHVTAYVPSDPLHKHELRFRGPMEVAARESKSGKSPSLFFKLFVDGLEIGRDRPRIDQGFYDFNIPHIGKFKLPPDPFVVVDLPRPDFITFTPPAMPVLFGGRPTLQPLDHILEYRIANAKAVRLKAGDKDVHPMPCAELLRQYEEYWAKTRYKVPDADSQRYNMEAMLKESSPYDLCVLFGVGFDPDQPGSSPKQDGINFFNDVLLPSFDPGLRRRLQAISSCAPVTESMANPAELIPATLTYPERKPHLLQVSSALDCQDGGILGFEP
jgi:hypothetical protein